MVEAEEETKAGLVRDLNALIFQSSVQQMEALQDLQARMDQLAAKAGAAGDPPAVRSADAQPSASAAAAAAPKPDAVQQARAEMEAVALVQQAEAAEARSRHVALPPRGKGAIKPKVPLPPPVERATAVGGGGFAGFE